MEWNFFRRNRERNKGYVGRTEVFRSSYDGVPEKGTTEEQKEATVADTEVKSELSKNFAWTEGDGTRVTYSDGNLRTTKRPEDEPEYVPVSEPEYWRLFTPGDFHFDGPGSYSSIHEIMGKDECISADDFLKILKYIVKPNLGLIFEDLPESSLGEIQGGYPSENSVDREWFYEKQQSAVNGLGEDQSVTKARESAARSSRADRYTELGGPEDFATFNAYLNGDLTDEQLQSIIEAKKASEHQRG